MDVDGDLSAFNTLGLEATAERLLIINTQADLDDALQAARSSGPITVLGGGSNVVLQPSLLGTVLLIQMRERSLRADDGRIATVRAGAGENWHEFVLWCHHQGLHGLANLALIPGSVGAAPIQNIGAYGVEVAERIRAVHVTDRWTGERRQLSRDDCAFSYRDSIFKRPDGAQWVVTAVDFTLDREAPVEASYPSLRARLKDAELTHDAVLAAVISIRRERLPDPVVTPNVGSFFKNPVVSQADADTLALRAAGLPVYPASPGYAKLSAAWLIDQLGWRGIERDGVKVSDDHALVLVGCGATSAAPWCALAADIVSSVKDAFGVHLEWEPQLLGEALGDAGP